MATNIFKYLESLSRKANSYFDLLHINGENISNVLLRQAKDVYQELRTYYSKLPSEVSEAQVRRRAVGIAPKQRPFVNEVPWNKLTTKVEIYRTLLLMIASRKTQFDKYLTAELDYRVQALNRSHIQLKYEYQTLLYGLEQTSTYDELIWFLAKELKGPRAFKGIHYLNGLKVFYLDVNRPRKLKRQQRRRGYSDKGSLRPVSSRAREEAQRAAADLEALLPVLDRDVNILYQILDNQAWMLPEARQEILKIRSRWHLKSTNPEEIYLELQKAKDAGNNWRK